MAVINVDDIYTLDNTGKQVDDAVDYALANSNRNLLDNPWFTVNQRQITTPSSPISGYPADRWYGTYSAVTSDGVTIPAQNSLDLLQRLEPSLCAALVGKTVTVSTLEQDGTIASFTCVFPAYGSGEGSNYNMGNGIGCFVQNVSGYQRIRFRISDARTTPFALRAAKLELGSYSTLANDVPPDYRTELDKCQYYFERVKAGGVAVSLGAGYNDGYNILYGIYKIKPKRVQPNLSGSSLLVGTTSLNVTSSEKNIYTYSEHGDLVLRIVSNNTFKTNQMYRFGLPANGYLDFSADL